MRVSFFALLGLALAGAPSALVAAEPALTPQAGGTRGFEFRDIGPARSRLVGLNVAVVPRSAPALLLGLQPIYATGDRQEPGDWFGNVPAGSLQVAARPGYAVGSVVVQADDKVLGLRLVFFRIAGDRLDPKDRYESRWLGARGGTETTLGGDGQNILGLAGRTTTVVHSLGLVTGDLSSARLESADPEFRPTPDYQQAVAEVRLWGVPLTFDEERAGKPLVGIEISKRCLTRQKIAVLGRLVSLRTLNLSNSVAKLPTADFAPLAALKDLRTLEVRECAWFRDPELALARSWPRLERLDLRGAAVTSAGLAPLTSLKRLAALDLSGPAIQDAALDTIVQLKSLEELIILQTSCTDETLVRLAELPALKTFAILSMAMTDRGVASLAKCTSLTRLELLGNRFTAAGLRQLSGLKLKVLQLGGPTTDDAALAAMSGQTDLESLILEQTKITDEGLKAVAGMKRLKVFESKMNTFTGSGLTNVSTENIETFVAIGMRIGVPCCEWLGRCKKIEGLQLQACGMTDSHLQHLAGLTSLKRLSLNGNQIGDAGILQLVPLNQLRELQLAGTLATGEGLDAFPELEQLNLRQSRVTGGQLAVVGKLKQLRVLDCAHVRSLSARGIEHLAGLPRLTHLNLADTRLPNAICGSLAKMRELEEVDLCSTDIDERGLAQLVSLSKLHGVALAGTPISDATLPTLLKLPALSYLSLWDTRVTEEALRKAHQERYYLDTLATKGIPDQRE